MPGSEVAARHELPAAGVAKRPRRRRRLALITLVGTLALALFLLSRAGAFLVLNAPEHADVIVVMNSEWPKAVHLQRQGYASRVLIEADTKRQVYGKTEADLVIDFLRRAKATGVEMCPTASDTKFDEAADVQRCLQPLHPRSVLIVNTDFDTRRSLSIFRKRLPQYRWSVAGAAAPFHDADQYWKHRRWAISVLSEWEDYLSWKLLEQWRADVVLR